MAFSMRISEVIARDTTGLLGKHPSWERVALGDVASILNGAPFDSALFAQGEGFPLLRIRDVVAGSTTTTYLGDYEPSYVVNAGDLLIGMDGDFNSAFWRSTPALLNQRVCKVTPNESFYVRGFLAKVLPGYLTAINSHTPSVTVKHLSSKTVGEIELPLPPLAEQARIDAKLDELLSDLDAGVAELKAAQRKLALYRQSLLKAAVEGALTADWRARNPPTETGAQLLERVLQQRRTRWEARQLGKFKEQGKTPPNGWQSKYPEPVAPDVADLPALPPGWVWSTIDQLAQVGTGVTPLRSKLAYFDNGAIPWVTSGALNSEFVAKATEMISELALKECRLEMYPVGALLVAMYGEGKTRGMCSELRIPATINQAIAALVLEADASNCKAYLKSFLFSNYAKMREQASGGVQPNLNLQIIRSIVLPLPSVAEQIEITRVLESHFELIGFQQNALALARKQSAAQRKNILQAAFSGQLVPQDPSDEPASVLLARMRDRARLRRGAVG